MMLPRLLLLASMVGFSASSSGCLITMAGAGIGYGAGSQLGDGETLPRVAGASVGTLVGLVVAGAVCAPYIVAGLSASEMPFYCLPLSIGSSDDHSEEEIGGNYFTGQSGDKDNPKDGHRHLVKVPCALLAEADYYTAVRSDFQPDTISHTHEIEISEAERKALLNKEVITIRTNQGYHFHSWTLSPGESCAP